MAFGQTRAGVLETRSLASEGEPRELAHRIHRAASTHCGR